MNLKYLKIAVLSTLLFVDAICVIAAEHAATMPAEVLAEKTWVNGWTLCVERQPVLDAPDLFEHLKNLNISPRGGVVPVFINLKKGAKTVTLWSASLAALADGRGDVEVLDIGLYRGHAVVVLAAPEGDLSAIILPTGGLAQVARLLGWSAVPLHMPYKRGRVKATIAPDEQSQLYSIELNDRYMGGRYVTLHRSRKLLDWNFDSELIESGWTTVNADTGTIEPARSTTVPVDH